MGSRFKAVQQPDGTWRIKRRSTGELMPGHVYPNRKQAVAKSDSLDTTEPQEAEQ